MKRLFSGFPGLEPPVEINVVDVHVSNETSARTECMSQSMVSADHAEAEQGVMWQ